MRDEALFWLTIGGMCTGEIRGLHIVNGRPSLKKSEIVHEYTFVEEESENQTVETLPHPTRSIESFLDSLRNIKHAVFDIKLLHGRLKSVEKHRRR